MKSREKTLLDVIILNIEKIIQEYEISRTEFAERLGTTPSEVSRMLNQKVLSIAKLESVAKALGVDVFELVTPQGYKKASPPAILKATPAAAMAILMKHFIDLEERLQKVEYTAGLDDGNERL